MTLVSREYEHRTCVQNLNQEDFKSQNLKQVLCKCQHSTLRQVGHLPNTLNSRVKKWSYIFYIKFHPKPNVSDLYSEICL